MGYTSLSVEKEVLDKVNQLYEQMNRGKLFKSRSSFLEIVVDFFLEDSANRKALLKFWIEKNPELKETLALLLSEDKKLSQETGERNSFEEELKEVIGGFHGLEDKEI